MILFAAIVMLITGAIMVWLALWYGRDNREAWKAFDLYYPATWTQCDVEGNWKVTITIPPYHGKPDVSVELEDGVIRSWKELNG